MKGGRRGRQKDIKRKQIRPQHYVSAAGLTLCLRELNFNFAWSYTIQKVIRHQQTEHVDLTKLMSDVRLL